MFNKYYQDELAYLRELGREFSEARPEAARFLGEAGSDPDVERLLEGFAFLTGRIRQKLDDELPELTQAMMELFFPQFLRPTPAMAILQVEPREGIESRDQTLPRGSVIDAAKIDDVSCRFRTTVDLQPMGLRIRNVDYSEATPPTLKVELAALPGFTVSEFDRQPLRIHLVGDAALTRPLYQCLCSRVRRISVNGIDLPDARVAEANQSSEAAMLPAPDRSAPAIRVLQEYFLFPARFMFVDVEGLALAGAGAAAEIEFEFDTVPEDLPPFSTKNLLLNCVPIVNLFDHDADPVRVQLERNEYKIRPSGSGEALEVYAVDRVHGRVQNTGERRELESFFSFHRTPQSGGTYFEVRAVDSVNYEGLDHLLILGGGEPAELASIETLSLDLQCSNRRLADRVGLGDISTPGSTTPLAFTYRNVTKPTSRVSAPSGDDVHWQLLSNLSLNYSSLLDTKVLCSLLRLYDFRAREDRQARRHLDNRMDAILEVSGRRATAMFSGAPIRGIHVTLRIDEDKFGGEGEVFLFGTVFSEFLSQYVTLNSFSKLSITLVARGDTLDWSERLGEEMVL